MAVFVLRAREKSVLLLVVPEKTGLENIQTSGEQLIKPQQFDNNRMWTDMRALCQQIWRRKKNPPPKSALIPPYMPHSACLFFYSLVDKLVINASDRGVQNTSVFPDLCLQSKTFLIRVHLHTFSLWLNIAPVQYFFKALFNKVSFFGRQIFSLKRSYFLLVWENST